MVQIPLPPGYKSAVPFDKTKHRRLGIVADAVAFAKTLNVIFIAAAEFGRACHDFPIAFAKETGGNFAPVAVVGLNHEQNLFYGENGQWDAQIYCPAYIRRYPFFTASIQEGEEARAIICVDETALDSERNSLIDATGELTASWQDFEVLITEMDREQVRTADLCSRLDSLGLFEAFEADFHPVGKPEVRVAGLYRVSEQRLRGLSESQQAALLREGVLSSVFAHLLSLENFNRLLNRYAKR